MKRVLIITYYWPPNGGAGVYRWLKFAKYLPMHGWQPVIYTPSNPEMAAEDPGLLRDIPPGTEIIEQPIREPFALYKRFTGRKADARVHTAFLSEERRGGWREKLALWVRANFFVPDARVGWVRPSVRFLTTHLKEHPVDAVVTTGPPHSMHLIGLGVKRAIGLPWVADFRDPWTNIDFMQQMPVGRRAMAHHRRFEKDVLEAADLTVTVSWTWAEELRQLGARRVEVVTNGYDPDDVPSPPEPVDEKWSLVHVGAMSATRDVPELWQALAARCASDAEFKARFVLRFVGPVDHSVIDSIQKAGLGGHLELMGRVAHDEAMRQMQRARMLLLPLNDTPNARGIIPGKAFEYLDVGRPILAVGDAMGDAARILKGGHIFVQRGDVEAHCKAADALFGGSGSPAPGIVMYSREHLAGTYARLLEQVIG